MFGTKSFQYGIAALAVNAATLFLFRGNLVAINVVALMTLLGLIAYTVIQHRRKNISTLMEYSSLISAQVLILGIVQVLNVNLPAPLEQAARLIFVASAIIFMVGAVPVGKARIGGS